MQNDTKDFALRNLKGKEGRKLEIGSRNVNGEVKSELDDVVGIDMEPGKGVDLVLNAYDCVSHFGLNAFDYVYSLDVLEHADDWERFLSNAWSVLKPGGVLVLTMASIRKNVHGYPHDYWRFREEDFRRIFSLNPVIDMLKEGLSIGVAVEKKTDQLDFDVPVLKWEKYGKQKILVQATKAEIETRRS